MSDDIKPEAKIIRFHKINEQSGATFSTLTSEIQVYCNQRFVNPNKPNKPNTKEREEICNKPVNNIYNYDNKNMKDINQIISVEIPELNDNEIIQLSIKYFQEPTPECKYHCVDNQMKCYNVCDNDNDDNDNDKCKERTKKDKECRTKCFDKKNRCDVDCRNIHTIDYSANKTNYYNSSTRTYNDYSNDQKIILVNNDKDIISNIQIIYMIVPSRSPINIEAFSQYDANVDLFFQIMLFIIIIYIICLILNQEIH